MQNRVAVVGARLGKGTSLLLFTRLCSYTGPFNFFFQINFVAFRMDHPLPYQYVFRLLPAVPCTGLSNEETQRRQARRHLGMSLRGENAAGSWDADFIFALGYCSAVCR